DRGVADGRSPTGVDRQNEGGVLRRTTGLEARANLRLQIAAVPVEGRQRLHNLVEPRGCRQHTDALGHLAAQRRLAQRGLALELDAPDTLDRHQAPDERDAALRTAWGGFGTHADVLKASEADEMVDGFA